MDSREARQSWEAWAAASSDKEQAVIPGIMRRGHAGTARGTQRDRGGGIVFLLNSHQLLNKVDR